LPAASVTASAGEITAAAIAGPPSPYPRPAKLSIR
jgi:hypothetical protein